VSTRRPGRRTRARDELLPPLLDRLREPGPDKGYSPTSLDKSLRKDVERLLSSTPLESIQDLSQYPEVRRSVVNYGLPALVGSTTGLMSDNEIKAAIEWALTTFEPRIDPASLRIEKLDIEELERRGLVSTDRRIIAFEIEAEITVSRWPDRLRLTHLIDPDTGQAARSSTEDTPAEDPGTQA